MSKVKSNELINERLVVGWWHTFQSGLLTPFINCL